MAITYTKDIPDFTTKVKQVTDITELETTVSQLSASLVTVQGDVREAQGDITTLAGAMTTANAEIDDIWESNNVLGSKNLLVYPYNETTKTAGTVTYTDNGDGTVTVNGTATDFSTFYFVRVAQGITLPKGNYIITGTPSGGSSTTYNIRVEYNDGTLHTLCDDVGAGGSFTITETIKTCPLQICILVRSGSALTNEIFQPMIRPASYQDTSYAPYAMTNKDITNIVKCNQTTNGTYTLKATVSSSGVTYAWTADS